jgi:hypothetical protein
MRTAVLALVLTLTSSALGQQKLACSDGRARVKDLQKQNKLLEARDLLLACARPTCPAAMRRDCSSSLDDVSKLVPSVVLSAKDERGNALVDVTVEVDGIALQEGLTGIAVDLDPGDRVFRFKSPGRVSIQRKEAILVGERGRALSVEFGPEGAAAVAPPQAPTPVTRPPIATAPAQPAPVPSGTPANVQSPPPAAKPAATKITESPAPKSARSSGPAWVPVIALGALGVSAIASSVLFGLSAKSEAADLRGTCAPNCSDDALSDMNTKLLVSDILLGVGAVSIVGAVVVYFVSKPSRSQTGALPGFSPMQFSF